jgi:hypothetical protein
VRKALATLPWVEQASIQTDVAKREVRFDLKDKKGFNEDEVRKALQKEGFKEVTVRSAPPRPDEQTR